MNSSPAGFQRIIGKRPWRVWKGVGSFLIFEFGRPRRNEDRSKSGTFTLWIYMATWRIRKDGRELAHSESPDEQICRAADALTGKKLEAIVLNQIVSRRRVEHGATFCFEDGLRLTVCMYDRSNDETIFFLYTPEALVNFDYDGAIRSEPMSRK